jgi:hypothetical protein
MLRVSGKDWLGLGVKGRVRLAKGLGFGGRISDG